MLKAIKIQISFMTSISRKTSVSDRDCTPQTPTSNAVGVKWWDDKKGMTLMEILAGSLLFALVVITVSSILAPMMMAYTRANDIAEYNTLLDSVANHITGDIAQAVIPLDINGGGNNVTITTRTGVFRYTIRAKGGAGSADRGILQVSEGGGTARDVFSESFYRRMSVAFSVVLDDDVYILTMVISPDRDDGSGFSRDYSVRPMMLQGG